MINILPKNNINDFLNIFEDLLDKDMLLYIIHILETEIDFFIYERIITYKVEKNNILLPFKPLISINKVYSNLDINNLHITYKLVNNFMYITSNIDYINLNNLHLKYIIEYCCGYDSSILESFPMIKKIIQDTYVFYILNNKFQLQHKEYIDFLKKNISLLM
jgi:hypothetical protein